MSKKNRLAVSTDNNSVDLIIKEGLTGLFKIFSRTTSDWEIGRAHV
jgi:hypothetical protein